MKQISFYGIITGLVIAGWMYLEYLAGFHSSNVGRYTGFAAILFTIIGLFFGIRAYRYYAKDGQMSYWQGVLSGVVISVFAGFITALFTYIYLVYINPGFVDFIVDLKRQTLIQQGASEAKVQSDARATREMFQPIAQALRAFGGYVAAGSLFSLVIAGFLKTRRNE